MDKLIKELHKAFDYINEKHYDNELIEPVITIQRNNNKKKMILGFCSVLPRFMKKENDKERHFYNIGINYDYLDRGYQEVLGTFYHEICHMSNAQHNIDDCNPRSQNHNENFKKEAEKIGLIVEKAGRTGWSQTSLSEGLLKEIEDMDLDKSVFDIYMIQEHKEEKERKPRKLIYKYKCSCCGKEIKSTEEELVVKCVECDCDYTRVGK